MKIDFFLFRSEHLSKHSFYDLRAYFIRRIGKGYFRGNVEDDFISLFCIFDPFYSRLGMERIPTMQMTMDKNETKNGMQIIRFKHANYTSTILVLCLIVINLTTNWWMHLGFLPGIAISAIIYIILLVFYHEQLEFFKAQLKAIELKLDEIKWAEREDDQEAK